MNTTKVILKNVSIETELFLKVTDRTKGSGVYLIVLCTDTPDSQIEFFSMLKIKLPQVFFQPDVCHSSSLSLAMVATIHEVESMLKGMLEINGFFSELAFCDMFASSGVSRSHWLSQNNDASLQGSLCSDFFSPSMSSLFGVSWRHVLLIQHLLNMLNLRTGKNVRLLLI
jgi:hypothetical protein